MFHASAMPDLLLTSLRSQKSSTRTAKALKPDASVSPATGLHGDSLASCMQVTAVVICEAAGPWGLVSTIEGIMATQAEKSLSGFLAFCTARCKGEALSDYTLDAEFMDEEFLDAAETLSVASSGDFGGGVLAVNDRASVLGPLQHIGVCQITGCTNWLAATRQLCSYSAQHIDFSFWLRLILM